MGNVVTLRDHTELQVLTGELDTVRGFAESLRAQGHEAANRLHTVVSLVELGRTEQAVEFATAELTTAQQLTDRVMGAVAEPVLAALLLGKSTEVSERGVKLVILRVADNGPGVDPASVPVMFQRGWTTKLSDGPVGHGLGLALVGQAVRRYDGGIEVEQDLGAVFTVRLPLRQDTDA